MDTKELNTFVTLYEQRNYQNASSMLNYAPSTLYNHVQALEKELGKKLIRRDGRYITLTGDGMAFLPYAKSMLKTYSESVAAFSGGASDCETIRIGGCETGLSAGLVPFLTDFSASRSDIRFDIQTSANARIIEWAKRKYVDIGFLFALDPGPLEGLTVVPLFREPVCAMTTPANPLARRSAVSMADFDGQKFAYTHDSCCLGEEFRKKIAASGAKPKSTVFLSGLGATLEYARNNDAVIIAPLIATRAYTEKEGLTVLPISEEAVLSWMLIIYDAGGQLTPGRRDLIRSAKRFAERMAGEYDEVLLPEAQV